MRKEPPQRASAPGEATARTDAAVLGSEVGHRLSRLTRALHAQWSTALAPLGLAPPQAAVLRAVAEKPGCSLRSLARALGAEPMTVKRCVDELEKRGLLTSAHRGEDRRSRALALSAAGLSVTDRVAALARQEESRLAAVLGAARPELERLLELLERADLAAPTHEPPTRGQASPQENAPSSAAGPGTDGHRAAVKWDARYAAEPWPSHPDAALVELATDLLPGRALDLGCGPGRNAVWLARRGWSVTGVDASAVGLEQAASRAEDAGVSLDLVEGDLLAYRPAPAGADLIVIANIHFAPGEREDFFARAVAGLAPGGHLLLVGHHRDSSGRRGPREPQRLYTEELILELLAPLAVTVWRRERQGHGGDAPAVDVVAWATAQAQAQAQAR